MCDAAVGVIIALLLVTGILIGDNPVIVAAVEVDRRDNGGNITCATADVGRINDSSVRSSLVVRSVRGILTGTRGTRLVTSIGDNSLSISSVSLSVSNSIGLILSRLII